MDLQPPTLAVHKRKYIHMRMLIQGPTQPANNINLYLQLLKEELATLWEKSRVTTWDVSAGWYFPTRAALITTVHDYLGCGYGTGQVCHGFCGCVRGMDNTSYLQLPQDPGSSKTVYMGHRRWLKEDDPWRRRGDLFDGTKETRGPPRKRSSVKINSLLRNWKECPAPGKKRKVPKTLLGAWKTRSVFWDLAYWPILEIPNSLDLMHIKK